MQRFWVVVFFLFLHSIVYSKVENHKYFASANEIKEVLNMFTQKSKKKYLDYRYLFFRFN